jgi:hypothetical protein
MLAHCSQTTNRLSAQAKLGFLLNRLRLRAKARWKYLHASTAELVTRSRFDIDNSLRQWRERGMPHRVIGTLIVVKQHVLDRWIDKQWGGADVS